MSGSKPKTWLDRLFPVLIVAKGLDGAVELVGGVLLLVLTPARIQQLAASWTHAALSKDPNDVVAIYVLHTADGLSGKGVLFGAVYLLVHGLVKIALVVVVLTKKLWAYPWLIGVLLLFIAYQIYLIVLTPTAVLIALTAFDVIIVALTWREYREQRPRRSDQKGKRVTKER